MKRIRMDKPAGILFGGSIFLCLIFVMQYGVFGSQVDWVSQHSVFPDYFRQRFYETGDLFPDFAWNLGGGQNIYNISYYGLFSPILLPAYLVPWIRMDDYIMGSSILCYGGSVVLFYRWLLGHARSCAGKSMSREVCFATACMFALAAPLLFHSYNQLMFVSYMPFLCLALIGTDDYFRRGKRGLLIGGLTAMIFTSFYFSIEGLAAVFLYGVGTYLLGGNGNGSNSNGSNGNGNGDDKNSNGSNSHELWRWRERLWNGCRFVGNMSLSVMLAGVLLVPTACSILAGRNGEVGAGASTEVFVLSLKRLFYNPYGVGLTALALICLLAGVICAERWQDSVIPFALLILLTVPAFGYLLNGGLYSKDKVFIPFLPLICLQVAQHMERLLVDGKGRSAAGRWKR